LDVRDVVPRTGASNLVIVRRVIEGALKRVQCRRCLANPGVHVAGSIPGLGQSGRVVQTLVDANALLGGGQRGIELTTRVEDVAARIEGGADRDARPGATAGPLR